ncbi:MAG: EVE domain-containing protein [Halofilum sp. (in: g-proteobacteria)]|nr:EVE domain-containing protein [Halofilum sp. (in: g-proteobacteria)]
MAHWLFKSEPDTFGIDDLAAQPSQTDHWDGVRNYQARNFMRDRMQVGEQGFFYHSNTKEPGIVGIVEIARAAYPDHTAFDPEDPHYDPGSDPNDPRWYMVDVRLVRRLERKITLSELKERAADLGDLPLVKKGNRLSIMPVPDDIWDYILSLE